MRLATPVWRCRNCRFRRMVVVFSLLGYLAALIGYPAPARVRKISDKPFPCQHHACGCADAEQCWRHCCCYTPSEKMAWARANHVTPPADAERVAGEPQLAGHDHEDHDHEHLAASEHTQTDCNTLNHDRAGRSPHRCCTLHVRPAGDGAADKDSLATGSPATCAPSVLAATDSDDGSAPFRFVVGDAWRNCRGLPTLWVTSGAAVPPPAAVSWQFSWDVVEWLSTSTSDVYGGILAPPVPPPRA